jgi:hypothetical protein
MAYFRIAVLETGGDNDVLLRKAEQELVPMVRRQAGFLAYEVGFTEDNRVCSISTWSSKAAAEAGAKVMGKWAKDNLPSFKLFDEYIAERRYSVSATSTAKAA